MQRRASTIVFLAASLFAGCTTTGDGPHAAGGSAATEAAANEWEGTAVPSDGTAIAIWPESYSGELVVLDVLPHGSLVKQGDVIAHLELRPIDEQIRQAELEAHSALVHHTNTEAKDLIDREAADSALEQAQSALDRARRAFEGWDKYELEFMKRSAELEDKQRLAGLEDQNDELAQLEKMYKADELVDATEEIVIKRSKRAIDLTKLGLTLAREQRNFQVKYEEALQTEAKREGVRVQTGALNRLIQSQAIDRRAEDDGLNRSKAQLADQQRKLDELRHDRELLTMHAPRSGILLHGSLDDYRPKQVPPRHERGSRLTARTELFTVSDPEKLVVAVDVPESKLELAKPGSVVDVRPAFDPKSSVAGKLRIEAHPEAKSAAAPENSYEANIDLDQPITGLRVGMRLKVKLAPVSGGSTTKSANHEGTKSGETSAATGGAKS